MTPVAKRPQLGSELAESSTTENLPQGKTDRLNTSIARPGLGRICHGLNRFLALVHLWSYMAITSIRVSRGQEMRTALQLSDAPTQYYSDRMSRVGVLYLGSARVASAREKAWHTDGPHPPIEFARRSQADKITLVINEGAPLVPAVWAHMDFDSVEEARSNLSLRESKLGYPKRVEGVWTAIKRRTHRPMQITFAKPQHCGIALAARHIWGPDVGQC